MRKGCGRAKAEGCDSVAAGTGAGPGGSQPHVLQLPPGKRERERASETHLVAAPNTKLIINS